MPKTMLKTTICSTSPAPIADNRLGHEMQQDVAPGLRVGVISLVASAGSTTAPGFTTFTAPTDDSAMYDDLDRIA